MKTLHYLILSILFLSSCDKFDWNNPYDPECPKKLFTPSSPGATMEGNSVKLTWSQQNDDISGFALFRSAEGESITNLTQTQKSTTQFIDANITPGKKYTYYVVAVAGTNKSDTVKAEIIPVIPITISTGAVTELAATSAKVSGNITNGGGGTVTSRGICWSTTPNPTINSSKTTEGTGAGQFTSALTNLLAGTTYYARAYGENSRGISYGSEITFTTLGPPKLTTTAVSNITATTAISGGTIISDGGSPITAKGVVWSTSPSPTIDLSTKTNDGTGLGNFTTTLSNLINNTTYYIRAYAINEIGTSYGEEKSFTTTTPIPELLKQGLVAYYPFTGNAGDSSGNGNHGKVDGAILISDRFNNLDKAFYFNGVNSTIYDMNPVIPQNNTFTISLWVKPKTVSGIQEFLHQNWAPNAFYIGNYNGVLRCGDSFQGTEVLISNNEWQNFIVVRNFNNSVSVYKNGVLVSSLTRDIVIGGLQSDKLVFGKQYGNYGEYFNGSLDDIRFYNRALTQAEITYLANN